jgi:hypothetical protein
VTQAVGQASGFGALAVSAGGDVGTAFLWIGVLIAACLLGGLVFMWLRRRYLDAHDAASQGGLGLSLADLRELRDRGELSEAEFERAKAAVIGAVGGSPGSGTGEAGGGIVDARSTAADRPAGLPASSTGTPRVPPAAASGGGGSPARPDGGGDADAGGGDDDPWDHVARPGFDLTGEPLPGAGAGAGEASGEDADGSDDRER